MPNDPKAPLVGELHVDATALAPFLVDLGPGELQGLRVAHEGVDLVIAEIVANQPAWGDKAGVTANDFTHLTATHDRIAQIDTFLPAARKLVEVLEESRAKQVDARERAISSIAKSAETRAKQPGNEELLGKYDKTREYRSAIAMKGVKTRQKNAQGSIPAPNGGQAGPGSNGTGGAPGPVTP